MSRWLSVVGVVLLVPGLVWADSFDESIQKGVEALQRQDWGSAITFLTQALQRRPDSVQAHYLRGVAYLEMGELDRAIADESDAIRLEESNWSAHKVRAVAYLIRHDYDLAISGFSDCIKLNPQDGSFYRHRGEAHTGKQDFTSALKDFEDAFRLSSLGSGDFYVFTSRGSMYLQKEDLDHALKDLDEALRCQPSYVPALRQRALVYQKKKQFEKSATDLYTACRLSPDDPNTLNSVAWFWSTCPDPKLRQGEKALVYATHVCAKSSWRSPAFLETLAAAYAEVGQFEEAIRWQKQAIERMPKDGLQASKQRLKLFEEKKPYRDEAMPGS
jgi:tetratricopeptide (TPR) repeat protein